MWFQNLRVELLQLIAPRGEPEPRPIRVYTPGSAMDVPREQPRKRRRTLLIGAGLLGLLAVTLVISRLAQAPPVVDRQALWIDTVVRGDFSRQVGGPGSLVPEEIRWVTARTAGRVERVLRQAGSAVEPDTLLLELHSPEVEFGALEAEGQHKSAEAALVDLEASLEGERLRQLSELARVRAESKDAERRAQANERLAELEIVGSLEYARTREHAEELSERVRIEGRRLRFLARSSVARLAAQAAEVERLGALARHQAELVQSLQVRAGASGVLQELPLEVGQRVAPGDLLAKVVEPTRLKAELRIPENQAREVQLGQAVEIDLRSALIQGTVVRIDPSVQRGTVTVDVALEGELPQGARPDLSVDGRIELERLSDVLFTGRPAFGGQNSRITLFRLNDAGVEADRVPVEFGGSSVRQVEIVRGLSEGDRVILSDMSEWDAVDRIRVD